MLLGHVLALAIGVAPTDVAAVGIVMSAREEARSAVLTSAGRARVVGIGDTAFGGRVAVIEADHVIVDYDSGRVRLPLVSGAAAPVPLASAASAPATEAPDPPRAMERQEIERRLGEESGRILAETTLIPAMEAGRVAGFTITRMPESTLLSDAGLRAGDVLTEVNGVPIDSLATLIGLWPRLQTATALRALVLRNGQPVSLSVTLQ